MSGYGYTAPINTASGAPVENRMAYSTCYGDMRVAPDIGPARGISQLGGKRKHRRNLSGKRKGRKGRKSQKGGACGCAGAQAPAMLFQTGGGGGTGGYSTMLSNDLGKVHAGYMVAPCPAAPVETQVGGAAGASLPRSPLDLVSYTTGYGYSPSSVVSTSSAHYLDQQGYNKTCAGGARRSRRRHRKGSRKAHRKSRSRKH